MRTEISTIIYSSQPTHQHKELLAEAMRVANLGGTFSIRHFYQDGWKEEFKINYPELGRIVFLEKNEKPLGPGVAGTW